MRWSFRTNGNYIDFVHTDETSEAVESTIFHLHNTSRCISWSLPSDTTRINFTIDEVRYSNILITDIDFDGTAMDSQDDFETGIEAMFTGYASAGGAGYLSYKALIDQDGVTAPVVVTEFNDTEVTLTWSRTSAGVYVLTASSAVLLIDKVFIPLYIANTYNGWNDTEQGVKYTFRRTADTTLELNVFEAGVPADDWLNAFPIEFYILP